MALRLCAQSADAEWHLLNHLASAVQGSEDAVLESVSCGSPRSAGWMPQLELNGSTSDHSTPAERVQQLWLEARSLTACLQLQLEQQRVYHTFYQTLTDYEATLEVGFTPARERLQRLTCGGPEDAREILDCTQSLISASLHWWRRVDAMMAQSRRVPPLQARLEPIEFKRPAQLLVDFAAPEATVRAGGEVLLVDNTNRDRWIVETSSGARIGVPSLCVTVAGPDPAAVERAAALRLRLLASWTIALKEVGRALIGFMLRVFRRMSTTDSEADALSAAASHPDITGGELRPLLATMEQLLQSYWAQHPDFEELRERMRRARASLAICDAEDCLDDWTRIDIHTIFLRLSPLVMPPPPSSDEQDSMAKQCEAQQLLAQLIRRYRDLARHWEAFRLSGSGSNMSSRFGDDEALQLPFGCDFTGLVEQTQHASDDDAWPPELLRLFQLGSKTVDGISTARSTGDARTYRTEVTIDVVNGAEGQATAHSNGMVGSVEPASPGAEPQHQQRQRPKVRFNRQLPATNVNASYEALSPDRSDSDEDQQEDGQTSAEVIEDYKREETEAKARLVISCVVDTKDKAVLSLDEAVQRGIVSWRTGCYLNRETGESMPIQAALTRGLIIAESRTEGRAKVKNRRVYGLVTLRSAKESGEGASAADGARCSSYLIYSALDVANGTALSFQAAKEAGLIDAEEGVFWNSRTGEALELPAAIRKGFVRARKVATGH